MPGTGGDHPLTEIAVRHAREEDVAGVLALSRAVYPDMPGWEESQLLSHLRVFPEGQLAALDEAGEVVGMAASLIVDWDDYDFDQSWRDFTAGGTFTNHDPSGRTLYGAEIMVHPERRRLGIGRRLYAARRQIVYDLSLNRIRAGARIPGYSDHAEEMSVEEYVRKVEAGDLRDPTLTFQLSEGFRVLAIVEDYMTSDRASGGYAVVIEWKAGGSS